jgi:hypothetical protein
MKYFILRGLLPEPVQGAPSFGGHIPEDREARIARWLKTGRELPCEGEHCFLQVPGMGRISVFVHDIFDAHLLIVAPSQEKAYALASPFRSCAIVYFGCTPFENGYEYLMELVSKPQPTQTTREISQLYRQIWLTRVDPDLLLPTLGSGERLFLDQIRQGCQFVQAILSCKRLALCLLHLERGHLLFAGFMTGSYYHHHYQRDREAVTKYVQRKKYLEERTRYDLAFLSCFRGVEALLGTANLKKHEIEKRVAEADRSFKTLFATTRWRSYHEVFSSRRRYWSIPELIGYYLDIRNAVAAHANPRPPFPLGEDQVLEIQRLVEHMLYQAALESKAADA